MDARVKKRIKKQGESDGRMNQPTNEKLTSKRTKKGVPPPLPDHLQLLNFFLGEPSRQALHHPYHGPEGGGVLVLFPRPQRELETLVLGLTKPLSQEAREFLEMYFLNESFWIFSSNEIFECEFEQILKIFQCRKANTNL